MLFIQETTSSSATASSVATAGGGLNGFVVIGIMVLIALVVIVLSIMAWRTTAGGRSWLDYGNFFIVALGIVSVLLAFLAAMVFATKLFQSASQVLAVLTALFGVIGTLVGTYFGVKAGSDAAEAAHNLAGAVTPKEPTILSVEPRNGDTDVDPDTAVTATFSEDMNPATITELTFVLAERDTGDPVPNAQVAYVPLTKRATLTPPAGALTPNTSYRATINTDVRDQAGNALPAAFTWEFTTG